MRVTVDGQGVEIASGASVLAAVQATGRYLPTLCWDPRTSPGGSCRTCLVAVERSSEGSEPENGRSVVASCTSPAAEGMIIHTDDPAQSPPYAEPSNCWCHHCLPGP